MGFSHDFRHPSFFLGNIGDENVFYNILEGKKPFSAIKTRFSKRKKKEDFSKGVNPWFWCKNWTYFDLFFLSNIGKKNVCYDILERKNPFLGNKKKFKKSKKLKFFESG